MNFPALGPKPVRPHVMSRFPSSEESKLSQAGCPRGRVGTRAVLGERKRPPHATGNDPPCALSLRGFLLSHVTPFSLCSWGAAWCWLSLDSRRF